MVCIDPGHGDWDYGAISPNGTAEKDITLAISLKLGELLENDDRFKVIYTRSNDEIDWLETANDSLKERINISKICNHNHDQKMKYSIYFQDFLVSTFLIQEKQIIA